jgi:hypothetical protein
MNHESTFPVQSEVAPGVLFHFHKPTATRRAGLLLLTAETRESVRKLLAEGRAIAAQPEDQRDNERFDMVVQLVKAQVTGGMDVMYLQWGLASVEGLTIDDKVPDVNTFIGKAPDALVQEALARVHEIVRSTDAPPGNQPQHTATASSLLVQ